MAWSYQDYEAQTTDADRLTRLRLHIGEVQAAIRPNVEADGDAVSSEHLVRYLNDVLVPRRRELERIAGTGRITFVQGVPVR